MATASISPTGGPFTLHMPAGSYQLSLLIAGVPISASSSGCTTNATIVAGQTITANLSCTWH